MSQDIYPPGTSTVTVSGTVDTELPTAAALADNSANPTTPLVGSCLMVWDGAAWDRWDGAVSASGTFDAAGPDAHDAAVSGNPVLMAGYASAAAPAAVSADGDVCRLWVSRTGVLQVGDGGGSITVDGTVSTTGDVTVVGKAAHGAAASGNPVLLGAKYSSTTPTSVDDGDVAQLWCDSAGRLKIIVDSVDSTVTVRGDGALPADNPMGATRPVVVGVYASASAPAAVSNDGDVVHLWASRTGVLQVGDGGATLSVDDGGSSLTVDGTVTVQDGGSTISVDDGGGSLTVDGTVAVSGTVTVDSELPAAAPLADNLANPTAPMVGAALLYWDATQWKRVPYTEGTVYSSAARTATPSAVLISNPVGCRHLHLWLDRTAGGGGSGIALELYANHIASGVNRRIWVDSALTASGAAVYHWAFGPGLSSTAGAGSYDANMRGHVPLHVPVSFYVVMSHLDGTSNTYSLYYSLTP